MVSDVDKKSTSLLITVLLLLLLSACSPLWGKTVDVGVGMAWTETPTPFLPIEILPTLLTSPSQPSLVASSIPQIPENDAVQIWISEAVSPMLGSYLTSSGLQITNDLSGAMYHLDVQTAENGPQTTWIYALVAPCPTITDDIQWTDFFNTWHGGNTRPFAGGSLWMDSATLNALSALWGSPASGSVRIAPTESLVDSAWKEQHSWGIVPFEGLELRWKVLSIDGQSPVSKDFDPNNYPLKVTFGFQEEGLPPNFTLPKSNRDPDKLTTLVMTGVTAMVRATAAKMERNGVLYPGKDIRAWLLSADLTHISNEIPFSENCPYPDPNQTNLVFCSDPKYIALLEDVGTDIVELTGNHFQDWGADATLLTLEMYNQRGWIYFGGGANLSDARSAKTIIHNGNKLAFIGCNPAGPQFAWATDYQPGASPCDFGWMHGEINRLRSEGYLPVVTFQYAESYSIHPLPDQVDDFRAMAAAGAVIVSGSQAHLPQTIEFYNGSFIHYGLGNLFFDQMDFPVVGTRREFIDRHIFYDGKYIGTELLTAMLEDYSRPRPMTLEERFTFLEEIFSASGW